MGGTGRSLKGHKAAAGKPMASDQEREPHLTRDALPVSI
jgi:hypothetical protein